MHYGKQDLQKMQTIFVAPPCRALRGVSHEPEARVGLKPESGTDPLRVTVRNNSTRLRRIWVRLQGTSSGAYRETCRWM